MRVKEGYEGIAVAVGMLVVGLALIAAVKILFG
jgi:hypothetical protein